MIHLGYVYRAQSCYWKFEKNSYKICWIRVFNKAILIHLILKLFDQWEEVLPVLCTAQSSHPDTPGLLQLGAESCAGTGIRVCGLRVKVKPQLFCLAFTLHDSWEICQVYALVFHGDCGEKNSSLWVKHGQTLQRILRGKTQEMLHHLPYSRGGSRLILYCS